MHRPPAQLAKYGAALCRIPGGRYYVGTANGALDERPIHRVGVSPFRMGATPVTVAMWREYVDANPNVAMPPAPPWGWRDDHPVVRVSWEDVVGSTDGVGYCGWASRQLGFELRLPTEGEYEFCAREGGRPLLFPWGPSWDSTKLWCSSKEVGDAGGTAPVVRSTRIHRNAYGLTDLVGNVSQWCLDGYDSYTATPKNNPRGANEAAWRVHRGGSWDLLNPDFFRCAKRASRPKFESDGNIGFRLVAPGRK